MEQSKYIDTTETYQAAQAEAQAVARVETEAATKARAEANARGTADPAGGEVPKTVTLEQPEVETAENLRRQLKEYLEEATKIKMELSEAKREIFKLQNKKQ